RPARLPWRRRLLALAVRVCPAGALAFAPGGLGLLLGRRLLAALLCRFGLLAAQPLGRGAQPAADALRLGLLGRLGLLALGVGVDLAADQLDLGDFGAVPAAVADSQDARVAARPRLEPRRDRVEQLADHIAVRDVAQDEAPRVQRLAVGLAAGQAAFGDG